VVTIDAAMNVAQVAMRVEVGKSAREPLVTYVEQGDVEEEEEDGEQQSASSDDAEDAE